MNKQSCGQTDLVFHFVAFGFLENCPEEKIRLILDEFASLKNKISLIDSFRFGRNNSPEGLNKKCSHGFILTFKTEEDRDSYLVHPEHLKFVELVKDNLEEVFVLDFTG